MDYVDFVCRADDAIGLPDPRTCGRNMFDVVSGNRLLFPIALTFAQDRDQIKGSLEQTNSSRETLSYAVTGFVRLNGALVLEGERPNPGLVPTKFFNWSSVISGNPARLSGGYSTTGEGTNLFGSRYSYRLEYEFIGLSRAP
jgi:hypothetical protein